MRKPHRKQLLAWLLTAALLLSNLPVSVLSEEIIENPIQTEIVEQNEPETAEEPNLPDSPTEETGEPTEPPVSEEPNETPESGEPSGTTRAPLFFSAVYSLHSSSGSYRMAVPSVARRMFASTGRSSGFCETISGMEIQRRRLIAIWRTKMGRAL